MREVEYFFVLQVEELKVYYGWFLNILEFFKEFNELLKNVLLLFCVDVGSYLLDIKFELREIVF